MERAISRAATSDGVEIAYTSIGRRDEVPREAYAFREERFVPLKGFAEPAPASGSGDLRARL